MLLSVAELVSPLALHDLRLVDLFHGPEVLARIVRKMDYKTWRLQGSVKCWWPGHAVLCKLTAMLAWPLVMRLVFWVEISLVDFGEVFRVRIGEGDVAEEGYAAQD